MASTIKVNTIQGASNTTTTVKTNGGLEYVYDLTPDIKFEYLEQGNTAIKRVEINNYSKQNIRGNIGFETIYLNGFTFSLNHSNPSGGKGDPVDPKDCMFFNFLFFVKSIPSFIQNK